MRRVFVGAMVLVLVLAVAGCGGQLGRGPSFTKGSGKVRVATSFYPMYAFTTAVAGDRAEVINLVPAGMEPHDWEPTPGDIRLLNDANLLVYNGAGMETWVSKTVKSLDSKSLALVEASKGLDLMKGDEASGEGWDPHVWLDPISAVHEVEAVRDALSQVDPAGKATYDANAAAYITKLNALDQDFRTQLTGCPQQQFLTTHAAFGYLARRYGLEQRAIMGLSPDAEPAPKDLAALETEAKQAGIQYVFFETLVSDKVAKAVAQEVGAKTMVLNPLEGLTPDEVKAGQDYISVMKANLTNLRTALSCTK